MRRLALTILLAASVTIAACGESTESETATGEKDVKRTVDQFLRAFIEGDGPRACSLTTEQGRRRVLEFFGSGVCDTKNRPGVPRNASLNLPRVDPIGAEGDDALAVVHLAQDTVLAYVLTKAEDG